MLACRMGLAVGRAELDAEAGLITHGSGLVDETYPLTDVPGELEYDPLAGMVTEVNLYRGLR